MTETRLAEIRSQLDRRRHPKGWSWRQVAGELHDELVSEREKVCRLEDGLVLAVAARDVTGGY